MSRADTTAQWAAAVTDGWVDLAELDCVPMVARPTCGSCRYLARWVDPSGVGWCTPHVDRSPHARALVAQEASRGSR